MPRHRRPLVRLLAAAVGTALLAALPVVTPRPPAAAAAGQADSAPGYWLVGSDGSAYSFGSAGDLGSLRGTRLTRPVVGMAPTPSGAGYWMVASDGGIFSFGDAAFHGSTGALKLNQPIVGMAATPSGRGYWFVAADGGIFSFGDAAFHGSTGAMTLAKPIVGMAATPSGQGYWFVASDGGIFNFGDATFLGSAGGQSLPAGIVMMSAVGSSAPRTIPTQPTGPTATTGAPATTTTTAPARTGQPFQIGLLGDSGYLSDQLPVLDQVVAHMNTFPLAFAAHDGDFKDPRSSCTDTKFESARTAFDKSTAPFVYTPGDNEWVDCDGDLVPQKLDPVERLAKLREMFFAGDESLGVNRMPLTNQRQDGYPENARWTKEGVVFVTVNAPGPSDNLDDDAESDPRRLANAAWLQAAFDLAESTGAPGVMVIWQTNPWEFFGGNWKYLTDILRDRTIAFGKPVVLVHGDTHVHRIDKGGSSREALDPSCPNPSSGRPWCWTDLPNFTRVETYAGGPANSQSKEMHPNKWIRATVDPSDPKVFTFATECVASATYPCS